MKKSISIILSFMLLLSVCFAGGINSFAENDGFEYKVNSDSTATVTGYNGFLETMKIPESIDGHTVTSIDGKAFYKNKPNYKCVEKISIPKTVKSISNLSNCFDKFTSLFSINVDSANPNYKSVKGVLFDKKAKTLLCYPQKRMDGHYIVPTSVNTIGSRAFESAYYLYSVKITKNVNKIGARAFYDCLRMNEAFVPKTVKSIGKEAFGYYKNYNSSYYEQNKNESINLEAYSMPLRGFTVYGYKGTAAEKYCNKTSVYNEYKVYNNYGKVKFKEPKYSKPNVVLKAGKKKVNVTLPFFSYLEEYEINIYKNKKIYSEIVMSANEKSVLKNNKTVYSFKLPKGKYSFKVRGIIRISGYTFKTPWATKTVTVK